jgi:hypothetical protein
MSKRPRISARLPLCLRCPRKSSKISQLTIRTSYTRSMLGTIRKRWRCNKPDAFLKPITLTLWGKQQAMKNCQITIFWGTKSPNTLGITQTQVTLFNSKARLHPCKSNKLETLTIGSQTDSASMVGNMSLPRPSTSISITLIKWIVMGFCIHFSKKCLITTPHTNSRVLRRYRHQMRSKSIGGIWPLEYLTLKSMVSQRRLLMDISNQVTVKIITTW